MGNVWGASCECNVWGVGGARVGAQDALALIGPGDAATPPAKKTAGGGGDCDGDGLSPDEKAYNAAKNALTNINNLKTKALQCLSNTVKTDEQKMMVSQLNPKMQALSTLLYAMHSIMTFRCVRCSLEHTSLLPV